MRTLVIWNPSARQTTDSHAVRHWLESRRDCRVQETHSRADALHAIGKNLTSGVSRVIAAGGDGTANVALQGIVNAGRDDVDLAVVPLGTGNDLARTLGMPLDPVEALELIFHQSATLRMDVIEARWDAGRRVVANMSTAGNTGLYMERLTDELKQRWGPFCYLRGVVDVIRDLQVFDVEFAFDDDPPLRLPLLNLFIAGGRTTGAGLPVAPAARLDDGLMDVVVIRDGAPGEIASLTASYLLGDFLKHDLVLHRPVRRLVARPAESMPVSIDGDPVTHAGVEYVVTTRRVPVVVAPETLERHS